MILQSPHQRSSRPPPSNLSDPIPTSFSSSPSPLSPLAGRIAHMKLIPLEMGQSGKAHSGGGGPMKSPRRFIALVTAAAAAVVIITCIVAFIIFLLFGKILSRSDRSGSGGSLDVHTEALSNRFGEKCKRGIGRIPLLPEGVLQEDIIDVWDVSKHGYTLPSMEYFYKNYIAKNKPLMIRGALRAKGFHWDALDLWKDDAYLASKAGNRIVNVERSRTGKFGYEDPTWRQSSNMKFANFLKHYMGHINAQGEVEDVLYMSTDVLDELRQDIVEPADLFPCYGGVKASPYLVESGIWFGAGGQNSLLHADPEDNILAIVDGYKRLHVFPPSEGKYLYENVATAMTSPIDIARPDYSKYPLYRHAKAPLEIILGPSDALFIPRLWFHQVESTCRHIAVNFWADLHDHQGLSAAISRLMQSGKIKSHPGVAKKAKNLMQRPSNCHLVEMYRKETY